MIERIVSLISPPKKLDCIVVTLARFDGEEFAEVFVGTRMEPQAKIQYELWAGDLRTQVRSGERFIKRVVMFHVRDGDVIISELHPNADATARGKRLLGDEARDGE